MRIAVAAFLTDATVIDYAAIIPCRVGCFFPDPGHGHPAPRPTLARGGDALLCTNPQLSPWRIRARKMAIGRPAQDMDTECPRSRMLTSTTRSGHIDRPQFGIAQTDRGWTNRRNLAPGRTSGGEGVLCAQRVRLRTTRIANSNRPTCHSAFVQRPTPRSTGRPRSLGVGRRSEIQFEAIIAGFDAKSQVARVRRVEPLRYVVKPDVGRCSWVLGHANHGQIGRRGNRYLR